jgi:hypothetical protein
MPKQTDDVIDRVRAVRRKISESVGHDPDALVRHYQELDQKHQDRILRDRRPQAEERKA